MLLCSSRHLFIFTLYLPTSVTCCTSTFFFWFWHLYMLNWQLICYKSITFWTFEAKNLFILRFTISIGDLSYYDDNHNHWSFITELSSCIWCINSNLLIRTKRKLRTKNCNIRYLPFTNKLYCPLHFQKVMKLLYIQKRKSHEERILIYWIDMM